MISKLRDQLKDAEVIRAAEARQLREQAELLPPGALRDDVIRKAQQAEDDCR